MSELQITIYGRPATKKNHGQNVAFFGRTPLVSMHPGAMVPARSVRVNCRPSEPFLLYQEDACWQIKRQMRAQRPRGEGARMNLCALYWMPDRRSWPDLNGLLQATCDILQAAHVVTNDRGFISFDGSRIAGIDKENSRVEITITDKEDHWW